MTAPPLLVCLDLERSFVEDGPLRAPHCARALLECARILAFARARRWGVAHCYLQRFEEPFCTGRQSRPIPGFEPRVRETVIQRRTFSAYGHPAFADLLEAAPGRSALVATLSASMTFVATAFDAFEHDHRLIVAAEAHAAQPGLNASADQHEAVARDIAARLGFPAMTRFAPDTASTSIWPMLSTGGEPDETNRKA